MTTEPQPPGNNHPSQSFPLTANMSDLSEENTQHGFFPDIEGFMVNPIPFSQALTQCSVQVPLLFLAEFPCNTESDKNSWNEATLTHNKVLILSGCRVGVSIFEASTYCGEFSSVNKCCYDLIQKHVSLCVHSRCYFTVTHAQCKNYSEPVPSDILSTYQFTELVSTM